MKLKIRSALLAATCCFLASCSLFPKTIKVGSKNTTEHILLGEVIAQHLEKKTSMKVDRRLGLGDASIIHQAAISRDVDIFAEDTATALSVIIKENVTMEPTALWERVRNEYDRLYGLQISKPIGAHSGSVMVIPSALAAKESLTDISGAAASRVGWSLGITEDFAGRRDGLSSLSTNYKLTQRQGPRTMDPTNLYRSLADGQINMISAVETDGMLNEPGVKTLADDKKIFASGEICMVVRKDSMKQVEGFEGAVNQLIGKVRTEDLRQMGRDALLSKRSHAEIAREFLIRTGLY